MWSDSLPRIIGLMDLSSWFLLVLWLILDQGCESITCSACRNCPVCTLIGQVDHTTAANSTPKEPAPEFPASGSGTSSKIPLIVRNKKNYPDPGLYSIGTGYKISPTLGRGIVAMVVLRLSSGFALICFADIV